MKKGQKHHKARYRHWKGKAPKEFKPRSTQMTDLIHVCAPGPSLASYSPAAYLDQKPLRIAVNRAIRHFLPGEVDWWALSDVTLFKAIWQRPRVGYVTTINCLRKAETHGFLRIDMVESLLFPSGPANGKPSGDPEAAGSWTMPKALRAILGKWPDAEIHLFGVDMIGLGYFDGCSWYDGSLSTPNRKRTRENGQLTQKVAARWEEEAMLLKPILELPRVRWHRVAS